MVAHFRHGQRGYLCCSVQRRVEQLTGFLAGHIGFAEHQAAAEAAARLALADLATATVTEMTALAGVMGRIYALRQGEQPEVAQAVFESVLPRCCHAFAFRIMLSA